MKFMAGRMPVPGAVRHHVVAVLLPWLLSLSGAQAGAEPAAQCRPVIEARADQGWFRVRPHVDAFTHCTLSREELKSLLQEFIRRPESPATPYHALFLGRLVDHPWLSRYLAEQALEDTNWDPVRGLPRDGDINAFVHAVLTSAETIALLQSLFEGTGYKVIGVSVEKILVAPANSITWLESSGTALVPFDALTHVTLSAGPISAPGTGVLDRESMTREPQSGPQPE